jgi:diguanylate cyclase (GGDEF)-like protein
MTIALIIEILILKSQNNKNSNKTSLVLLNQVVSIIEDNEKNENNLIKTMKEDYIIRAQSVSYILDAKPDAEYDVDELKKIASLMRIDEIHLFDTEGVIYSGTNPEYYGYNFDSGEQMAYFKPMLLNKDRTMCQDITPNTAAGKSMMYAITWSESGDKMVQVGIEPLRLLDELRSNEISEVVANMPIYEGIDIFVADLETGEIYGATESSYIEQNLSSMGIDVTGSDFRVATKETIYINGSRAVCNIKKSGDYLVVVSYDTSTGNETTMVGFMIEFIYLLIAGVTITFMFRKVLRANDERQTQMTILESVADIYNSMHLINIEKDTFMEYNARDEISTDADAETPGAAETVKRLMTMTTEKEFLEDALEFTDIRTIAERMKGKKIISEEFVSKAIGWYRASFITAEADEDGRPLKVIYVTQNIDKEKRKVAELIYRSNADQLTGLYNRRAYEEDIDEHNDTVKENNFVFVSLDVNGLKTVNDNMGHSAGDELLTGAAACMKRCFEPYGRVYRTGGDEFVAMIFANEKQLAHIKKDFEEVTAGWSGKLVKELTISTGYVTKREAGNASVHEMADMADKRMYEAKDRYYESRPDKKRRV